MTRDSAARPPRPARLPSVAVALLVATSCTKILGIDGNYVDQPEPTDHAGGSGGKVDANGGAATGGHADAGSGGAGGTSPVETGGSAGENDGGASNSGGANTGCVPGSFSGTFDGVHKPMVTFVGVQASVKNGTWSFTLSGTGGTLSVTSGAFQGGLTSAPIVPDAGSIDGTFEGSLDCSAGKMDGTLSGTVHVLNTIPANFEGTWDGSFTNAGFEGSWTENEPQPPGSGGASGTCIPGMDLLKQPIGSGCGKWNAR